MVPCQPRQLVILSLPFAALVAFFWFKRRRSLSRSDPGGTAARQKPGDKTAVNGKLTGEIIAKKIENSSASETITEETVEKKFENCLVESEESVKNTEVTKSLVVEEEFVAKSALHLTDSLDERKKEFVELVKSIETLPAVEKTEVVCNGSVAHVKDEAEKDIEICPLTPEFENRIFHSTIIESEKDFEESKTDNLTLDNQQIEEDHNCKKVENQTCEKQKLEFVNNTGQSSVVEQSDNKENLQTIPLEDQSTLEYIPSKKIAVENKSTVEYLSAEPTVVSKFNNCGSSNTENLEKVENTSTDTGLGSQEASATEECNVSMAQGQKTDEKSENNATGLEQKLASLGLDTTQQPVQRTERDSANHSPAEVMLNSPAISTFSDAHSEGSSDSGKGCSDVVTPPSRTPAGGSSVAGDLAPSVYEFVLPQVIVGRLIGRHGAFLQDIRAKTHTNVFIKKHPETNSLKICAIEGTQQDIDAALKMIRQKFPLRRFPDLTLEKVSFVKSPCLPINPENLQLHLVEGVNNDVLLSSLITAGHFFLQMPMHMSYQCLYKLACIMNDVYNTQESPPLVEPQPDVVCVAPAHGGWYRAQIMSVDEETNASEIKFLDYGGYMTVDNASLRQIRGDFLLLPFQAVECVLANVVPIGGEETWSEDARQFVQIMTTNQTLQAQVYDYTEAGLPLVYLYCTQFYQSLTDPSGYETKVVLLNQELVSHGYADLIDSSQQDQTTATESS